MVSFVNITTDNGTPVPLISFTENVTPVPLISRIGRSGLRVRSFIIRMTEPYPLSAVNLE